MSEIFLEDTRDLSPSNLKEFNTVDALCELPDDLIVFDRRDKTSEEAKNKREERDVYLINTIDRIISGIVEDGLDEHNRCDDELRGWMIKVLLMADRRREQLNQDLYADDSIITLVYEIWATDNLHRNYKRDSGENYARAHLFPSVINAIRDLGVSDLYTIVSILKHDDWEDWEKLGLKEKPKKLVNTELYKDKLSGAKMKRSVDVELKIFEEVVLRNVSAVTNYKWEGMTKADKHAFNFKKMLEMLIKYGESPVRAKIADRENNVPTMTVKGPEAARFYAEMTLKTFGTFAAWLRVYRAEARMVLDCYKIVEPDAVEDFDKIQDNRLKARLGHDKRSSKLFKALDSLKEFDFIKAVAVVPTKFSKYMDGDSAQDSVDSISPEDPMFEVLIIVDEESNFRKAKDVLIKVISTSDDHYARVEPRYIPGLRLQPGLKLKIENPDPDPAMGGLLNVRINTNINEARLDLGKSASTSKERKELFAPVQAVIDRTTHRVSETIYAIAAEHLKAGQIYVYTPARKLVELPAGSNFLDFAAEIHGGLVPEICGARLIVHGSEIPVSPFNTLKDDSMPKLIKEGDDEHIEDIDIYDVNLSWYVFAGPKALQSLRKYFRSLDRSQRNEVLVRYVKSLCSIYGFVDEDLELLTLELVKTLMANDADIENRKITKRVDQQVAYIKHLKAAIVREKDKTEKAKKVSTLRQAEGELIIYKDDYETRLKDFFQELFRGNSNPLKTLANAAEVAGVKIDSNQPLVVDFILPDQEGVGAYLFNEFKEIGVNARVLKHVKDPRSSQDLFTLSLEIRDKNTSIYDLMKTLLKIRQIFPCGVTSDHFKSLIPKWEFRFRGGEIRRSIELEPSR